MMVDGFVLAKMAQNVVLTAAHVLANTDTQRIYTTTSCHHEHDVCTASPDLLFDQPFLHQIAKTRNPDGTVTKPDCFLISSKQNTMTVYRYICP